MEIESASVKYVGKNPKTFGLSDFPIIKLSTPVMSPAVAGTLRLTEKGWPG